MRNSTSTEKDEGFQKIIEDLTPLFQKIYFFNRLPQLRKFDVVTSIGRDKSFQPGKSVFLGSGDFPILWMVKSLAESRHKKTISIRINGKKLPVECCEKTFLNQVFLWRRLPSDDESLNKLNSKFERRLKRLRAAGLVEYQDDPENRKKHLYYLTDAGNQCLQELQMERGQQLAEMFKLSEIQPDEFERILKEFDILAEKTWEIATNEAKSINLKNI